MKKYELSAPALATVVCMVFSEFTGGMELSMEMVDKIGDTVTSLSADIKAIEMMDKNTMAMLDGLARKVEC